MGRPDPARDDPATSLCGGLGRLGDSLLDDLIRARDSSDGGIVRPSALAVLRLTIRSNFVGYEPTRRYMWTQSGPNEIIAPSLAAAGNGDIVPRP
jgi:hypothetical protein